MGLRRLRILPLDGSGERYVESDEPDSTAWLAYNAEQATTKLRYGFTSLRTPESTFEVDMRPASARCSSSRPFSAASMPRSTPPSGSSCRPATARRCPSRSSTARAFEPNGKAPVLIEAYGSYGYSSDPYFDQRRSLAGRSRLRLRHRPRPRRPGDGPRTGTRTASCSGRRTPSSTSSTSPRAWWRGTTRLADRVFALGGSAGGLLMGAIATMRPELYRGSSPRCRSWT